MIFNNDCHDDSTEGFILTPLSNRNRAFKVILVLAPVLTWFFGVWMPQYETGALPGNWWYVAFILVPTFRIAMLLWDKDKKIIYEGSWEEVSLKKRILMAGFVFIFLIVSCSFVWIVQYNSNLLKEYWWYVWPVVLPCVILIVGFLVTHRRYVMTESAIKAKANTYPLKWLWDDGVIRYTIASIFCLLAWQVSNETEQSPDKTMVAIGAFLLGALYFARELAWVVLPLIGLWLLYKVVALLPVSVAIVLGAIIIALAIASIASRR